MWERRSAGHPGVEPSTRSTASTIFVSVPFWLKTPQHRSDRLLSLWSAHSAQCKTSSYVGTHMVAEPGSASSAVIGLPRLTLGRCSFTWLR